MTAKRLTQVSRGFYTKKLCSRLPSSEVNFTRKTALGTTYDVHLRLIGKRVVDFLLVLIDFYC